MTYEGLPFPGSKVVAFKNTIHVSGTGPFGPEKGVFSPESRLADPQNRGSIPQSSSPREKFDNFRANFEPVATMELDPISEMTTGNRAKLGYFPEKTAVWRVCPGVFPGIGTACRPER
ncbi:MAG: hypothetical protein QNK37_10555 [Acidobacteriota bacterium]|nr:hypothetical protein [Acidobacteriota bacterium]